MKNLDLSIFPKLDKNQWVKHAEKQLKGANPLEELSWINDSSIELEGYYDQSDLEELKYLEDFFSNITPHSWKLYERIENGESRQCNDKAIKALMGGCDGIILDHPELTNLDDILKEVNHEICDVNIVSEVNIDERASLTGFRLSPDGNCINSEEKEDATNQLFEIVNKIKGEAFIHRLAFKDFFLEIAAVRALRYLLSTRDINNIHIHTQVQSHESEDHQWFLNTTSGLASILGGSHSVDFTTLVGDSRISRNVGNLIREESGIEKYSDQCGGSYYIEVLTHKIIKEVSFRLEQ